MDITPDMIAAFYGSDNLSIDFLLAEMADILNEVYATSDARKDIKEYIYD